MRATMANAAAPPMTIPPTPWEGSAAVHGPRSAAQGLESSEGPGQGTFSHSTG